MSRQSQTRSRQRAKKKTLSRTARPIRTSQAVYEQGLACHRKGNLALAREFYCDALREDPQYADAWHMLGLLLHQAASPDEAVDCLERAVTLRPRHADQFLHLGLVYRELKRLSDAQVALELALDLQPDHHAARNALGVVHLELGNLALAEHELKIAAAAEPNDPTTLTNLGNLYQAQGRHADAYQLQQRATSLSPQNADAWNNLGSSLRALGQYESALRSFHQSQVLAPHAPIPSINLGRTLLSLGRLEPARQQLAQVCQDHPEHAKGHYYLGLAYELLEEHELALAQLERALELDVDYLHAICSRALLLCRRGDLAEARAALEQAIALRPDSLEVLSCYLFVLSTDPSFPLPALRDAHLRVQSLESQVTRFDHSAHDRRASRPLRIGYVSPDFRTHAVAAYLLPVLQHHDRSRVEVYCYSQTISEDATTEQMRKIVAHWRPTFGWSDAQMAEHIYQDGIDILIDLAGHTANNRLGAFMYKPAPIQMTWLGYPHTTGLKAVDYYITTRVQDPEGTSQHVETPLYLDQDTCFVPPAGPLAIAPPPVLHRGYVTFGSLHRHQKISLGTLDLWAQVLQANLDSRLVLFNTSLTPDAMAYLTRELQNRGLSTDRFELRRAMPAEHYLRTYDDIDVALDVFPWSGGTTTREALWMGVPVIGFLGDRRSARSTAATLTQVGLPEWIATTPEEYVRLSTRLAANPQLLVDLRNSLRDRMTNTICNAPRFTRLFEETLHRVWQAWCALPSLPSDPPQSLAQPLAQPLE